MSSLLDHHRRRVLWTDLERERYYRILADHWEDRLNTLRNSPSVTPEQISAEAVALKSAQNELRKIRIRLMEL